MLLPSARDSALDPPRQPTKLPALRIPWGQIAAIVVIATLDAWLSRFWPPVPWNAIIWLGSSVIIGCVANKGAARIFFALVLALIFLVAFVGNEAVAHLVFGTCLYD